MDKRGIRIRIVFLLGPWVFAFILLPRRETVRFLSTFLRFLAIQFRFLFYADSLGFCRLEGNGGKALFLTFRESFGTGWLGILENLSFPIAIGNKYNTNRVRE